MYYAFPPDVESQVQQQLATGSYRSEDDVLRAAMAALEHERGGLDVMQFGCVAFAEPMPDSSSRCPSSSKTGHWTEQKDDRRCQLIDREIGGELTDEERPELDVLQREMLDYRRRVAPLPIEAARRLHKELLLELADADE